MIDMTNMVTYKKVMISLNINEIKTHFSSFLAKVINGETVIVCKRNVPVAEIKPIATLPNKKRPIGLAGKEYPDFKVSDAFFEPLPDDIVAAFNGEDS
jgi:antitoxin (DNA-binding transcriptional repressor) of toxin-antitoxin stability system